MRWSRVCLESIAYELPVERVSTDSLEARLGPLYGALGLLPGQVAVLTGIRERRMWPRGPAMADCAAKAAVRALEQAGLTGADLGAVAYTGVCRDNLEPATACAVAEAVGVSGEAFVFDLSNACLGVLNGIVEIANRIELGQIRAGLVVSAESSREIVDATIARMNADPTLERYRLGLATLTGGSGAVAVVLTEKGYGASERRLLGGTALAAPEHHRICRWGPDLGLLGESTNVMDTDASQVLQHGVGLGQRTWKRFLETMDWRPDDVDRVICHQVGSAHRRTVLTTLGIAFDKDFSTYETLGNMGTVSVPLTAARAEEAGFLRQGDRVAFLGIGSGLNCMMLALQY
jgi:3-oxoacyl-[acyl-carrier-protein] synthase-3